MARFALLLATLLLPAVASAGPLPSTKEAYAKRALKEIRGVRGAECALEIEEFTVHCGDAFSLYLGNTWAEYREMKPAEKRDHLARFARSAAPLDDLDFSDPALTSQLRPRIKSWAEFRGYDLVGVLRGQPLASTNPQPLSGSLAIDIVVDLPESMLPGTTSVLEGMGLNPADALTLATTNLRQATAEDVFQPVAEGVWAARTGDSYDSSRLLLTGLISKLPLQGDPVVMVANRGNLLVAGSDDVGGLARLAVLGEEAMQQPRWVTGGALILRGGSYSDWLPGPEHPSHAAFRYLSVLSRGQWYAQQKEVLDAVAEAQGLKRIVGSFGSIGDLRGGGMTFSVVEAVTTLLPEVDLVVVVGPDEVPRFVPWAAFAETMKSPVTPDTYPPRYEVDPAAVESQWSALEAVGLTIEQMKNQ
ncbi:MAG: hypothetical protein KDA24_21835 [Deltaproteobacteria bacterium]|nr:hypothetical protein [Deltaproteobacteria bacterium]